jgi:hypothetical protein
MQLIARSAENDEPRVALNDNGWDVPVKEFTALLRRLLSETDVVMPVTPAEAVMCGDPKDTALQHDPHGATCDPIPYLDIVMREHLQSSREAKIQQTSDQTFFAIGSRLCCRRFIVLCKSVRKERSNLNNIVNVPSRVVFGEWPWLLMCVSHRELEHVPKSR